MSANDEPDDLRALVITGAGGAFCSGADISTPEDIHPRRKLRRLTDVALALHELTIRTIAKVTGVAVGAGWNLALGCDFVVATPESLFCQVFSKRGFRDRRLNRGVRGVRRETRARVHWSMGCCRAREEHKRTEIGVTRCVKP